MSFSESSVDRRSTLRSKIESIRLKMNINHDYSEVIATSVQDVFTRVDRVLRMPINSMPNNSRQIWIQFRQLIINFMEIVFPGAPVLLPMAAPFNVGLKDIVLEELEVNLNSLYLYSDYSLHAPEGVHQMNRTALEDIRNRIIDFAANNGVLAFDLSRGVPEAVAANPNGQNGN